MAKVDAIGFQAGKVFAVGPLNSVKAKMDSLNANYSTVQLSLIPRQCHADKWVGSLEEGKMADYM